MYARTGMCDVCVCACRRRAVKRVFGVEPDLTREGGSIPITLKFEEATGKNVLMLPVGQGDDGAHSQVCVGYLLYYHYTSIMHL